VILQKDLQQYLKDLLFVEDYVDYCPNGLQVEGKEEIQSICTAVTASKDIILEAAKKNADALLVHHGFFWKGEPAEITGMKFARIKALIDNDINLFAYHLPIDCHPELGNNRQLANRLPLDNSQSHQVGNVKDLLWTGTLSHTFKPNDLQKLLHEKLQRQPLMLEHAKKEIQTIAWCSGGAQDLIVQAHALGADAYISGEVSERTYYQALELGIHYFSCGHHATERYGVQALGQHLASMFHLEHYFLDSHNPV
jgi:dinuclear metal center YbgI/SA1388 family protein